MHQTTKLTTQLIATTLTPEDFCILQAADELEAAERRRGDDKRDNTQDGQSGESWRGGAQARKAENARTGVLVAVLAAFCVNLGKVLQKRGTQDLPLLQFSLKVVCVCVRESSNAGDPHALVD